MLFIAIDIFIRLYFAFFVVLYYGRLRDIRNLWRLFYALLVNRDGLHKVIYIFFFGIPRLHLRAYRFKAVLLCWHGSLRFRTKRCQGRLLLIFGPFDLWKCEILRYFPLCVTTIYYLVKISWLIRIQRKKWPTRLYDITFFKTIQNQNVQPAPFCPQVRPAWEVLPYEDKGRVKYIDG